MSAEAKEQIRDDEAIREVVRERYGAHGGGSELAKASTRPAKGCESQAPAERSPVAVSDEGGSASCCGPEC